MALDNVTQVLQDPNATDVYDDISIRGIPGKAYHCKETNTLYEVPLEGKQKDSLAKVQKPSDFQLEMLRKQRRMD